MCGAGKPLRLHFYLRWLKKNQKNMFDVVPTHLPQTSQSLAWHTPASPLPWKTPGQCSGEFRVSIYFWCADRWHHVGEECTKATSSRSTSSPRNGNYTFLWTWHQPAWIFGLYAAGQCTLGRYEMLSVHAEHRETVETSSALHHVQVDVECCLQSVNQRLNIPRLTGRRPWAKLLLLLCLIFSRCVSLLASGKTKVIFLKF